MKDEVRLKQTLAKMLPERLYWGQVTDCLEWKDKDREDYPVDDTELLHLCWLVENSLSIVQRMQMRHHLTNERPLERGYGERVCHATWQQRVVALAKVKGIEIL